MIPRQLESALRLRLAHLPATALLGPRQVGKTTLVKHVMSQAERPGIYLDLENPADRARLSEPTLFLEANQDSTIVLDEVHRLPEVFPLLRGLIDRNRVPGRFVLLGSASYDLLRNTSESLAGRIAYLELSPLLLSELPQANLRTHWFRGGFPNSFLAPEEAVQQIWLGDFLTTYLEKDLPQLGLAARPALTRRLLTMLAHNQGNLVNYSSLANSLGLSQPTVTGYVDFLERALLLRRLPPYFSNVGKRLIKSPKLYLRDSGLLHRVLGIPDLNALLGHPVVGGSWEGYALEQVLNALQPEQNAYFYRTSNGAELDVVVETAGRVTLAIEIKLSDAPTLSRGTHTALADLGNPPLLVLTPSAADYPLSETSWVGNVRSLPDYLKNR
ncbi:MAG: ATP-binding protein [Sphingobacteriaceae bacterium]|nr:ATP-binding protein [Cytophagaceae bacterium]